MSDPEFPSPWPPEIPPEGEPFVYHSVNLYEANFVADELEKAGLPVYRAVETPMGQIFPMPVVPGEGRGWWWRISVPPSHAREAAELVNDLPVSHDPDPPSTLPPGFDSSTRGSLRALAWIELLAVLAIFLYFLLR